MLVWVSGFVVQGLSLVSSLGRDSVLGLEKCVCWFGFQGLWFRV